MTTDALAAAWYTTGADCFDWRCWDGEGVVYVLATGATHELGSVASGVLSALLRQPGVALTEAQLLAALDDEAEEPASLVAAESGAAASPDDQELRTLRELLGHMAGMGLVGRQALNS
jgi:hypothetical protein